MNKKWRKITKYRGLHNGTLTQVPVVQISGNWRWENGNTWGNDIRGDKRKNNGMKGENTRIYLSTTWGAKCSKSIDRWFPQFTLPKHPLEFFGFDENRAVGRRAQLDLAHETAVLRHERLVDVVLGRLGEALLRIGNGIQNKWQNRTSVA